MAKIQYFGIKFPFVTDDDTQYFFDLNTDTSDEVKSMLYHLIFTPKGQKIRDPQFGTDLVKFIFQPNDELTWDNVSAEIDETVKAYIPNIIINNVNVYKNENDEHDINVKIDYSVVDGSIITKDSLITKL